MGNQTKPTERPKSNGRGGARKGSGRPKGAVTKKTRLIAEKAAAEGVSPLEYMLSTLRNENEAPLMRFEAAKAAAPYIHPKLAAIEHSGNLSVSLAHELAALNRAV